MDNENVPLGVQPPFCGKNSDSRGDDLTGPLAADASTRRSRGAIVPLFSNRLIGAICYSFYSLSRITLMKMKIAREIPGEVFEGETPARRAATD
jgi:hypothetical protein